MKKRSVVCAATLALTLLAPTAGAQGPAAKPSTSTAEADALNDKARQLYEEGMKAGAASKWAEAHASLLAAWRIKQHYQIAVNLGVAELKLGKHRDAAEHLAWYLHEAPATKMEERKHAAELLKEAQAKVATIEVKVLAKDGAEVHLDRVPVGKAPLAVPLFLEPGRHYIFAKKEMHTPDGKWVDATAGGRETVTLILEPDTPESRAPLPGYVRKVAPASSATVGTPSPALPAGDAADAEEVDWKKIILVGGGITAGAALGTGIVFTLLANGKASDARDQRAALVAQGETCTGPNVPIACADLQSALGAKDTFSDLAAWSFIGAGALGVGTLIYAFVMPEPAVPNGARAVPWATADSGGMLVKGTW
jgi:hypothetical protein